MERVSIISGKLPILLVAPHGYYGDDERTDFITETIARNIGAYAVINRGWQRDNTVDYMKDKANCNNVNHCHEDVVREEILEPIIRYKNRILMTSSFAYIFYIHGMSNVHRHTSEDPNLDIVVGYGAGAPNSLSCELWRKDLFMNLLLEEKFHAYEGAKGGPMSGWGRSNMNQLFRKWYHEPKVQSMQIEIIHELREDVSMALITSECLGQAMKNMLSFGHFKTTQEYKSY